MDSLTFDAVKNVLPEAEKTSSLAPYKTYLKVAEPIGYKQETGILKYILDPVDTCKKLKAIGVNYKKVGEFFKVVKWCAGKARTHIPNANDVITDGVWKQLDMYNTNFVDDIYGKTEKNKANDSTTTKVIKMDSEGIECVDVTDVEDELDEEDDAVSADEESLPSSERSSQRNVDINKIKVAAQKRSEETNVEASVRQANLKQLNAAMAELKRQNIALKERVMFHEKLLLKVIKSQHNPEILEMLFEGMCGQFE
jgi:hypothetical protein